MAAKGVAFWALAITICVIVSLTDAIRYGLPAGTIHFKGLTEEQKLGPGMRLLTVTGEDESVLGAEHSRKRRSTGSASSPPGSVDTRDHNYTTMVSTANYLFN